MSPRGRARKHDPSIPAHIDQASLPAGVYWDRSGRGRWFVFVEKEGRRARETIAGPTVKMSELHQLAERDAGGPAQGTVAWMCGKYHASAKFKTLAPATQRSYGASRKVIESFPTQIGMPFGKLQADRLTQTNIQRMHERIVQQGHPSKANHALRYLRVVFKWAGPHLGLKSNPARGIEQAKERGRYLMPEPTVFAAVLTFARDRAQRTPHTPGSIAPYLPAAMELAFGVRLRGVEAVTLTDAQALEVGIQSNRTKGSLDNVTRWTPRLRAAWAEAAALRAKTLDRTKRPIGLRPQDRPLFLSEDGYSLTKAGFDNAFVRMMKMAIKEGVLTVDQRFTMHGLKHRGITDTKGTRAQKKDAAGHKTDSAFDRYDHELQVVEPAGEG